MILRRCTVRTRPKLCLGFAFALTSRTVLSYMHVLPEYQRRGLGQLLMEQALKDADRDGAQAFLLATDAGKRLYEKFGFRSLEVKELDFMDLGASGKRNTTAQIREPERKL
jgi:predicted N-acetyltransferase YhbS